MSSSQEATGGNKPPYFDQGLVIDTKLSAIQREQKEEKEYRRQYDRKQLRFNRLLVIFTALLFVTSTVSDILTYRYVSLTKTSADAAKKSADTAACALEDSGVQFRQTLGQIQAQTVAQ